MFKKIRHLEVLKPRNGRARELETIFASEPWITELMQTLYALPTTEWPWPGEVRDFGRDRGIDGEFSEKQVATP
jgi:hypothetical protein